MQVQTKIPLKYLIAAIAIVFLSAIDALFTIKHIDRGAEELMPVMRWILTWGNMWFITVKMGVTAGGAVLLCMWYNIRLARIGLIGTLAGYAALLVYHLLLANTLWSF